MSIILKLEPQELDFILTRMAAGQMDFSTAMNVKSVADKIAAQANDKDLQSYEAPARAAEPPKEA